LHFLEAFGKIISHPGAELMFTDLLKVLTDFCQDPARLASFGLGLLLGGGLIGVVWWKLHRNQTQSRDLIYRLCARRCEPEALPEHVDQLDREIDDLKQRLQTAEQMLAVSSSSEIQLRTQLQRYQTDRKKLGKHLRREQLEKNAKQAEIANLRSRIDQLTQMVPPEAVELRIAKDKLRGAECRIGDLENATEESKQRIDELISTLDDKDSQINSLKKQIVTEVSLRTQLSDRINQSAKSHSDEIERLNHQIQDLRAIPVCNGNVDEIKELQTKNRSLEVELFELRKKRSELEAKLAAKPVVPAVTPPLPPTPRIDVNDRIWERPVSDENRTSWVPFEDRRVPIISVLNLKGGVGKTTVTLNLAATRWAAGQNVLMLDFDFQGSLTFRCLSPTQLRGLNSAPGRYAHHFFQSDDRNASAELCSRVEPVTFQGSKAKLKPQLGRGFVLGADEALADVETAEMFRWLLKPNSFDVRFRLRHALHSQAALNRFDCIFIDCPPRLTTACINALAASDFVLIPVLRDRTSTERVPMLRQWLVQLAHANVCNHLRAVHVLANRTHSNADERDAWAELPGFCASSVPTPFDFGFLQPEIRHDSCYVAAARGTFPAVLRDRKEFDSSRSDFDKLNQELKRVWGIK
jgi:cellulose biosynthesis protein BcsQ/predicted  nucleic acid-binding Zn-ribbon protein